MRGIKVTMDDKSFLLAYSDFLHRDEQDAPYKAILTRRVVVGREDA